MIFQLQIIHGSDFQIYLGHRLMFLRAVLKWLSCRLLHSVSSRMEARQRHSKFYKNCFSSWFKNKCVLIQQMVSFQIIPDPSGKLKYFDKLNWWMLFVKNHHLLMGQINVFIKKVSRFFFFNFMWGAAQQNGAAVTDGNLPTGTRCPLVLGVHW